jgi:hypothetical protein
MADTVLALSVARRGHLQAVSGQSSPEREKDCPQFESGILHSWLCSTWCCEVLRFLLCSSWVRGLENSGVYTHTAT